MDWNSNYLFNKIEDILVISITIIVEIVNSIIINKILVSTVLLAINIAIISMETETMINIPTMKAESKLKTYF